MKTFNTNNDLLIDIDMKGCELSEVETQSLHDSLEPLKKMVENFPITSLHVYIEKHARSNAFSVKTVLGLSSQTLVTSHEDQHVHPALEACIGVLMDQVQAFKMHLGSADEQAKIVKGTHQEMLPTQGPSGEQLDQAIQGGDYVAFRTATLPYEEALSRRVGRWVTRYPEIEARIGNGLTVSDIVEAVFLDAFDRFEQRPAGLRMGEWLEGLIDHSLKALLQNPEAELENIRFAQTLEETETGSALS